MQTACGWNNDQENNNATVLGVMLRFSFFPLTITKIFWHAMNHWRFSFHLSICLCSVFPRLVFSLPKDNFRHTRSCWKLHPAFVGWSSENLKGKRIRTFYWFDIFQSLTIIYFLRWVTYDIVRHYRVLPLSGAVQGFHKLAAIPPHGHTSFLLVAHLLTS